MRKILPRKTSVNEAERPAEKRAPRICAREGCERPLSKNASQRSRYCSPACSKAAAAGGGRPSSHKPQFEEGKPRAIYNGSDRIGEVVERHEPGGRLYIARDRLRRDISVHDSFDQAAAAIVRKWMWEAS
jgi:hypothetical protein